MAALPTTTRHASILIVEDAPEFQLMIEETLRSGGYEVSAVGDGICAVETVRTSEPDVVVLDLGLPGLDGIEVCRQIRHFSDAYIVMLTGRDEDIDCLVGLAVGADDYITKPFSPRELLARIQVLLRRPRLVVGATDAEGAAGPDLGDLCIEIQSREVRVAGKLVQLTKIEFDLLQTLAARPQMVFGRGILIESVWGSNWIGDDHIVDVHIANLRAKLDANGIKHIKTVRGVGYRLCISGS